MLTRVAYGNSTSRISSSESPENVKLVTTIPAISVVLRNEGEHSIINMKFEYLQVINLTITIETLREDRKIFPEQEQFQAFSRTRWFDV